MIKTDPICLNLEINLESPLLCIHLQIISMRNCRMLPSVWLIFPISGHSTERTLVVVPCLLLVWENQQSAKYLEVQQGCKTLHTLLTRGIHDRKLKP